MIDIKFLRENPDAVKENIKKKFQDHKIELVDKVIELDAESRAVKQQADDLRSNRNKISKQIGALMAQGKKEEGMALKEEVTKQAQLLAELEENARREKMAVRQLSFDDALPMIVEHNEREVPNEIVKELEKVDVNVLTPIEALNILNKLKSLL